MSDEQLAEKLESCGLPWAHEAASRLRELSQRPPLRYADLEGAVTPPPRWPSLGHITEDEPTPKRRRAHSA